MNYLKWIAGIIGSLGTIAGGVNWYVDYRIEEYLKDRKGGFRTELSKETGLEEHQIPRAFGEMYRDLHGIAGSIDTFSKHLLPMLIKEKNTIDVGLKVNKITGELTYINTDGRNYIPVYSAEQRKYYIVFSNGMSEWCY